MLRNIFGFAANRRTNFDQLIKCEQSGVWLRFMTMEDLPQVFEWMQDDPQMIIAKEQGAAPCYDQYHYDMRMTLHHEDEQVFLVAERDGVLIGTAAIYHTQEHDPSAPDEMYDIGYIVDAQERGKGYGTVLAKLASALVADYPQQAHIREFNHVSMNTIRSAGFTEVEDPEANANGWHKFEKPAVSSKQRRPF